MRSLRVKLVAAFVLTSVLGIGLSALFIRQFVVREFDDYVIAQRRTDFVELAQSYYTTYGAWDGLDRWIKSRTPPFGNQPPGNQSFDNHGHGQPDLFAVTDAAGQVVVPFGPYRMGEIVAASERAQGETIVVGEQTVGYVLTPQRTGFRNPAEEQYLARTDQALGMATVIVIAIALALGIVLTRLMIRPLQELTLATQQIAGGNLQHQVRVRSRDEIGILAMQFNRMSADLARANQLRQQMTADIAHDLRTPLTVISGYLESLRDQVLKPTPARFATLYDETQILLHLVEDLHTLSLADAGELSLNRRPIILNDLLNHVAATYQHAAEQQAVALIVQTEANPREALLDAEQITRVLRNLLSNALRYTPEHGQITLTARTTAAASELIVTDSGSGIEPEHLANIFERFYRVDTSRHQETGGSGLGLAIVKSIVELHAGTIAVASTPGQGTTFTITLPHPPGNV
jgi:signal transduction histidine kinase